MAVAVLSTSSFATTPPTVPTLGSATTIAGIGATFPQPLYNEWFSQFKADNPAQTANLSFSYAANGSGAGVSAIQGGTADYGASDVFLTDAQTTGTAATRGVQNLPMTVGGVVLAYRLAGVKSASTHKVVTLKLNYTVIAQIYAGQITYWNNAAIKAINPGVIIPKTKIIPVRRSDSSGTTYVFQSFLRLNTTWKCILSAGPQKTFNTAPQTCLGGKAIPGVAAPRNAGVAAKVASANGAIGYMEYAYALTGGLTMARVKNKSGVYLTPTTSAFSSAAAAAAAAVPADLRAAPMIMKTGVTAWPITSFSYLMSYQDLTFMGSLQKAQMYVAYLYWALNTGQSFARPMGYAPLPASIKAKAIAKLHNLQYSSAAVWP
jgi:phosphate transport system substrate-binding protein